jgi:AI-2 transport protein TqsA
VLGSLSSILSNAFMIILYVIFILLEESSVKQRLKNMYSDKKQLDSALDLIGDINKSISSYISLKTLVSILTATLSYVGLRLLHVDFPVLWAIVIFVLNYIPTIGSLVATLFPALLAWLQFNDPYQALYVLIAIGAIQIVVGNFLEPKIMGNSLNISPLVVILSLSVFGSLWGITGMILCVPFTVILIIIFSHFDSTRGIAVLLSDTGILAKKKEVKG